MTKPCRGKVVADTSGKIVDDLFFGVRAGELDSLTDYPRKIIRTTYEPYHSLNFEASHSTREDSASGRCAFHPERIDTIRYHHVVAGIVGSYADGEIMGGCFQHFVYLGPRTQRALLELNPAGLRFATCELESMGPLPFDPESIRVLCFDGRKINRPFAVDPPSENHCSQCGFTPIVCPTCDEVSYFCPSCNHRVVGIADDYPAGGLSKDTDYPTQGEIVDFSAWDGNEFNEGAIVTGRVVDLLFSLNPTQLGAQSLRCYVGDHDASEYEHLCSKLYREGTPEIGVYRE